MIVLYNMGKKDKNFIESLGRLYPEFPDAQGWPIRYKNYIFEHDQAYWISMLCVEYLNQRIPRIEKHIKRKSVTGWSCYKMHFGIEE